MDSRGDRRSWRRRNPAFGYRLGETSRHVLVALGVEDVCPFEHPTEVLRMPKPPERLFLLQQLRCRKCPREIVESVTPLLAIEKAATNEGAEGLVSCLLS